MKMMIKDRKLIAITILISCISCVKYTIPKLIIRDGARLKIESNHDETVHLYDVHAQYLQNAAIESTVAYSDSTSNLVTVVNLIHNGEKTVFFLNGFYEPLPYSTAGAERFSLFMALDSFNLNDTIYFSSDEVMISFYYEKLYSGLLQTGLATKLNGYLVAHTMNNDTLSGNIRFEAETIGSYSNILREIYDDSSVTWISARIEFKAIKKKSNGKSEIIGRFRIPSDNQTDSEK